MVQESEYIFEKDQNVKKGIATFIWNPQTKEFLGRDGASWAKISLFYAVFYFCLASFFCLMLLMFMGNIPHDKPKYYGEESTMNMKGLNPGLGFRPMIDVESDLISFNPKIFENPTRGHLKYIRNLENFLDAKYSSTHSTEDYSLDCAPNTTYKEDLLAGKYCRFDYANIFKETNCTRDKKFSYDTNRPCILIKLNKIISWNPNLEAGKSGIEIVCEGEHSADRDNLKKVTFHSDSAINSDTGVIDKKYFPFMGQKGYKQPFVWAQFDVPSDTLVNILCKANAKNIDNSDKANRRGQTKFSLYIQSK